MKRRTLNMMCQFVLPVVLLLCHEGRPSFAQTTPSAAPTSALLTFTVDSSKHTYRLTEPIVLTLTLNLDRRAPTSVTVNTFEAGTITVAEALLNGQGISPMDWLAVFDDSLEGLQLNSLVALAPGQSVSIPFDVLAAQGGGALISDEVFPPDGTLPMASVFPLTAPGSYTLQLQYQYTGLDGGQPNVFRGVVVSNAVNFRLR
jgi:hypothetical protein